MATTNITPQHVGRGRDIATGVCRWLQKGKLPLNVLFRVIFSALEEAIVVLEELFENGELETLVDVRVLLSITKTVLGRSRRYWLRKRRKGTDGI